MPKITTTAVAAFVAAFSPGAFCAQVQSCTSQNEFPSVCTQGQYCCPNNNYKLTYSCPSGWSLSETTCSRNSTTGSDDTGYYTQEYGSCTATSSQQTCCTVNTTGQTSGGIQTCIQCIKIEA